jgi:hypothetical protein
VSGKPHVHYWHTEFKLKEEKFYFPHFHMGPTCDRKCVHAENWYTAQMQMGIQIAIPNKTQIGHNIKWFLSHKNKN